MASRWRRAGLAPAFVVLAWAVVVASAEAEPVVQLEVPTSDMLPPVVAFEGPRGGSLNPVPIGRRRIPRPARVGGGALWGISLRSWARAQR